MISGMHELSLITNAIHTVELDAAEKGIAKVSLVQLQVGELSGAFPHALEAAFPLAAKGTVVEGAILRIDEVPAKVQCKKCGREFRPTKEGWACPKCGSHDAALTSGTELKLVSYTGEALKCP
jgi:hydrogenase nickel incorporation protein HypA/HybF